MRKILKRMTMIALCAMLVGCGGTETKEQTTEESQTVQVSQQVSQEETKINIPESATNGMWENSYVDIQKNDGKYQTRIYLDSVDATNEELIYFTANVIGSILNRGVESDFYILFSGNEYKLNTDGKEFSDIGLPEEWVESLSENADEAIMQNISLKFSNSLDDWVEYSFNKYLDDVIVVEEESIGKQTTENITESSSAEDSNSDKETVLSEIYEFEEGSITMILSKDSNNKYYFTMSIISEIPWKAAYAYYLCSSLANSEDLQKVASPSVIMGCGDVFISDSMSWKKGENSEMEIIDGNAWVVDTISEFSKSEEYSEETVKSFADELSGFITDFMEK